MPGFCAFLLCTITQHLIWHLFNLMKDIRDLDLLTLAATLERKVAELPETFAGVSSFYLHMQNSALCTSHVFDNERGDHLPYF